MDISILAEIEEFLNNEKKYVEKMVYVETTGKYDPKLLDILNTKVKSISSAGADKTIYEEVISCIKELNNPQFLRSNGEVKEAAFYNYARIDKSTWSDMKWNQIKIQKKTLLKLALALNLNREQTEALLLKGGEKLDLSGDFTQDKLILAIIDIRKTRKLTVQDIEEIIYWYQDIYHFDSIYETAAMIAERKQREHKGP